MKRRILFTTLVSAFTLVSVHSIAQKCTTMQMLDLQMKKDPSLKLRMQEAESRTQQWISVHNSTNAKKAQTVISIPVVVHVVYNNSDENISDAQILSQLDVINKDFRKLNIDTLPLSHPFAQYTADCHIEFCLASTDVNGNATTGITRHQTDSAGFAGNGSEKHAVSGGADNWDPTKYLNLWVCNLNKSGGTLGYATFPSELANDPSNDGVVIHFQAFGTNGTAGGAVFNRNNGGRTASHEIGHWLNLRHIWGDAQCGDDMVADTKVAEEANYGVKIFPWKAHNTCGTDANGEMYMNYMDYVDDSCMSMFTTGQSVRMLAALNTERAAILTSNVCSAPTAITELASGKGIDVYPNPSNGNFTINCQFKSSSIEVFDVIGAKVKKIENVNAFPYTLNLSSLDNGTYFIKVDTGAGAIVRKVFINK